MVDVRGNDRSPPCHLVPHEFGCDFRGKGGSPGLPGMLEAQLIPRSPGRHFHRFPCGLQFHVFPDGDELHLRGDDPLARIVQLGDASLLRPPWLTPAAGKLLPHRACTVALTVILRPHLPALIKLRVPPLLDPGRPGRGQPLPHIRGEIRIPPGPAGVVHPHRIVGLQPPVRHPRGLQFDFPERNPQVGPRSLHIHPPHALDGIQFLDFLPGL